MTHSVHTSDLGHLGHIVIYGGGLAGYMTAAALLRHLPTTIEITHVIPENHPEADIFYGSVTAPSTYDFNLSIGLSEPRLVLESPTAFSLGTEYQAWGGEGRSWLQGFQLPLPILNGVQLHQYLAREQIRELEPFLISAAVARQGAFAHPPEDASQPLSRAEYGYQFDVAAYSKLFVGLVEHSRMQTIYGEVAEIYCRAETITSVHLSDGQTVKADLFVDCTGSDAALISQLGARRLSDRCLNAAFNFQPTKQLGPAVRSLNGQSFGWQSITPWQNGLAKLTIFTDAEKDAALASHGEEPMILAKAHFGRQSHAWIGNCVAVGQAAAMIEPLTPAPIMLLQRDIGRLLSLIPSSSDMSMECREFNRQFVDDYEHAELFRRTLFATPPVAQSAYWRDQNALPVNPRLDRKIEQFLSRGILVSYDLEPFTPEDWVILHYGMGRRPQRHDRLADQAPETGLKQYLETLRRDIDAAAYRFPSHDNYMSKLKRFLMQEGA